MAKSEQPPIYVHRRGNVLAPEMELDAELIQRFHPGDRIKVSLHTGRSPSKLRWYWAYLGRIVKANDCAPSPEALHELVKLETGFTTPLKVRGYTVLVPRSIAFGSMSEQDFDAFLQTAIKFIADAFGITPEQVFEDAA